MSNIIQSGGLRSHGHVTIGSPEGGVVELDTKQCCHCGAHWEIEPGSGKLHVFCSKCNGWTCSNPNCIQNCIPQEKWLDYMERGIDLTKDPSKAKIIIAKG